jgi:hypothetical protein
MAKKVTEPEEPQGADLGIDEMGEGAALVAAGATLMRIENETMQAVSVKQPRIEKRVLAAALEELELAPDLAARTYYSIPFAESKGSERKFQVEGPSVNAAMNLARRWGNCAVRSLIMAETEDQVHLSGEFVDYETNFRISKPFAVSKLLKRRDGRTELLRDQRLVMAVQAGSSKAVRNAILSGLPDYLVETYYQRAKAIAGREAKSKWTEIQVKFREFGVTPEMLESHVGHELEQINDQELADLRGIFNALRDGLAKATDVFAAKPAHTEATSSVEDVVSQGADVTAGTEAPSNGESPSKTPASTPKSVDPQTRDTPAEEDTPIGADGAIELLQTADARAEQIDADVGEIVNAIRDYFKVEYMTALPKSKFNDAKDLINTAEFEPEEKPAPADPQPAQGDLDVGDREVGF